MINSLLGIKKGMTSTYDARGRRVGATMVEITSNFVTQIKTPETKDNYHGVQLGFGTKKSVRKPQLGHSKKANIEQPIRWLREVKEEGNDLQPGQEINLSQVFSTGDSVKVQGTSKGKGFQGGVRRHGFHGGPKTHGQSDRHRAPGSIGQGTTPGRVYKGKRMAGHMGNETVTTKNLEVVKVDKTNNLLILKGAVPGPNNGLIMVTKLGRIKGYTPPPEEKEDEEEASESVDKQSLPSDEGQVVSGSENTENVENTEVADAETPAEAVNVEGDENAS